MLLRIPGNTFNSLEPAHRRSLATLSTIQRRSDRSDVSSQTTIIVAAVVVGIIVLILFIILIRTTRARHPEPKHIPTKFLKRLWTNWQPSSIRYTRPAGEGDGRWDGPNSRAGPRHERSAPDGSVANEPMRASANQTVTIDRNTSVRSVMTLPAYRIKATDAEQVLGVAGERDGIDIVVELPTMEQEEVLRDEEMEALYQIREARRRQIAEREQRNQRRELARTERDEAAMRAIRDEARTARAQNLEEIEGLRGIQEQAKQERQRAVSSVSYADVGLVRHDGTRARANSTESERVGLLSDAASIAASMRPTSSLSTQGPQQSGGGGRPRSSSVLSVESINSRSGSSGGLTRSRASSRRPRRLSSASTTRAGSSPELIDAAEADLGDSHIPRYSPPAYDEVSLSDDPSGSFHNVSNPPSGRNSPSIQEPPPEYPGPTQARNSLRLSRHVADSLAPTPGASANTIGSNGSPQLPSLNLQALPQIVIEPSTARPRDDRRYPDF